MLQLNNIFAQPGSVKKRKRLGRGAGSGKGQTAGKGDKGQLARSGGHSRPGFEGGQTPLYRRLPKRGFNNPCARTSVELNLADLELLDSSLLSNLSLAALTEAGVVKGRYDRLHVLGNGKLSKKVTLHAHKISAVAREAVEKAGGTVALVEIRKYIRPKKEKKAKKAKK